MPAPQSGGLSFEYSTVEHHMDTLPKHRRGTWKGFLQFLATPIYQKEKGGPSWLPALFGKKPSPKGSLRHDGNVQWLTALVWDLDGEKGRYYQSEELQKALKGYEWAAHTTFSHTPEKPRWRVIFPLDIYVPPEQLKHAYQALEQKFGIRSDSHCHHPGRLFFSPSIPPEAHDIYCLIRGKGKIFDPYQYIIDYPPILHSKNSSEYLSSSDKEDKDILKKTSQNISNRCKLFTSENFVRPENLIGNARSIPLGRKVGWRWPTEVSQALANSPALRKGERHCYWQLTLARALLRCPVSWTCTKLWLAYRRWHQLNQESLGTPLGPAWVEFLAAFLSCPDQKDGLDIGRLREDSQEIELLPQAARLRPRLKTLLKACIYLQRWHRGDPFFITLEDAGRLLGARSSQKETGRYALKVLVKRGYLEQLSQGSNFAGRANTYRMRIPI